MTAPPAAPTPALETLALAKRFGNRTALDDLSMIVGRGEAFGFLGPNGAGKTTAIKLLLGLVRPTSGAAEVLGAPLGDRAARRRIGYLPELFRYQEWLTAREVLAFHAGLAGVAKARRKPVIDDVLETVGLHARADSRVATFSKGMQQRLGLGVALVGEPELVFLDEPTSALDPVGRRDVRAIVERLRDRGASVFLNSHLLTEVERVCDRVAFVDGGRVVAQGKIGDILGAASGVRLEIGAPGAAVRTALERFGPVASDGTWTTVAGVPRERIPDVVAAAVSAGAAVYAVEPLRASLEDRFLQLLKVPDDDSDVRARDGS